MKHSVKILAIGLLFLSSCNYLDVVPQGTATLDDIFSSSDNTRKFLNTLYTYIPNYATYRYMPDFCAGGDVITSANGQTRYFPYKSILYGDENANQTYYGLWDPRADSGIGATNYDLYKAIRYAWMMLDRVDDVPNLAPEDHDSYVGEAYFLIALYHWILMQNYGPVVLVDKEISFNASTEEMLKPRSSWDECADFVCDLFDRAAASLPAVRPNVDLGRATSVAAKAYKARVLMYSASPLVNGNAAYAAFRNRDGKQLISQTYDREKWKRAMDATEEAIKLAESNGYALYTDPASASLSDAVRGRNNYYNLFIADWRNGSENGCGGEYLFAFGDQTGIQHIQRTGALRQHQNGETSFSYTTTGFRTSLSPTLACVDKFLTRSGLPLWADPDTKSEFASNHLMSRATGENGERTARLHIGRDPRFYATVGYNRGNFIYNGVTDYLIKSYAGEYQGYTGNVSHEYNVATGYFLQKYISISTSYTYSSQTINYARFPWPLVRLAELYLDYAEADFEYDNSLSATGKAYIDKVHARAGLPSFDVAWSRVSGGFNGLDLASKRRALHEENLCETCCEGRWYHNLRRWNVIQEYMSSTPDALNVEGTTEDTYYTLVPQKENGVRRFEYPKNVWLAIPLAQLEINNLLVQNPGY